MSREREGSKCEGRGWKATGREGEGAHCFGEFCCGGHAGEGQARFVTVVVVVVFVFVFVG